MAKRILGEKTLSLSSIEFENRIKNNSPETQARYRRAWYQEHKYSKDERITSFKPISVKKSISKQPEIEKEYRYIPSVEDYTYRVATVVLNNGKIYYIKFTDSASLNRQIQIIIANYKSKIASISYSNQIPFATFESPSYRETKEFNFGRS